MNENKEQGFTYGGDTNYGGQYGTQNQAPPPTYPPAYTGNVQVSVGQGG